MPNGTTSVLQRAVVDDSFCMVMQGDSWCCKVLHCVALCVTVCFTSNVEKNAAGVQTNSSTSMLQGDAGNCSAVQCVAVRCSALHIVLHLKSRKKSRESSAKRRQKKTDFIA